MNREEYQIAFNQLIKDVSELIEVSGNYTLVKLVKKRLFDFSDVITGQGERDNGLDKDSYGRNTTI